MLVPNTSGRARPVGEGSALGRAFELTAGAGPERPAWGADRVGEEEALQARLLARLEAESGGSGTAEEGEGVGMVRDRSGGATAPDGR